MDNSDTSGGQSFFSPIFGRPPRKREWRGGGSDRKEEEGTGLVGMEGGVEGGGSRGRETRLCFVSWLFFCTDRNEVIDFVGLIVDKTSDW